MDINYDDNVFINCPFDEHYTSIFQALVFAIHDAGFVARSALEINDAGQVRLEKIINIISESKYSIHDLSRVELDSSNFLPRFNMPLELGILIGAKRFGNKRQASKAALIMDKEPYRYQIFISDIAGQD